jgi:hypothetical protein
VADAADWRGDAEEQLRQHCRTLSETIREQERLIRKLRRENGELRLKLTSRNVSNISKRTA